MLWLILAACGKHAVPADAVPLSACPVDAAVPLSAADEACVADCVGKRQMMAVTEAGIEAACADTCAGPVVRSASDLANRDGQRVRVVGVVRETTGLSAGEGWLVLADSTQVSLGGPLPHGWDGLLGKCVATTATLHTSDGKLTIEQPDGPLPLP